MEFKAKYFLTLTLHGKPEKMAELGYTAPTSSKYIKDLWHKLLIYLERRGVTVRWIWVQEYQEFTENAHLHVVLDRGLNINWLREKWTRLGGGPQMWIEVIGVERIGKYLAKYLQKGLGNPLFKRYERRYGSIRGFKPIEKKATGFQSVIRFTSPLEKLLEYAEPVKSRIGRDLKLSVLEFAQYPLPPPF